LEYEEKMIARVNFLSKEEQRFLRKILKVRENAEKMDQIKSEKINSLRERIEIERKA
jgi:predicted small metal-binding protein